MFESLTERLTAIMKKVRGHGKLTEASVAEILREVRLSLLEADVNFKVVKGFIAEVKEKALGAEVMESLTPAQQFVKIVHAELKSLMGGKHEGVKYSDSPPTVIMLCGLQGSGKTTTAGKLAIRLAKDGRRPLLVAGDVYRPAAVEQLKVVGGRAGFPVFELGVDRSPVEIATKAMAHAAETDRDLVIIDTAGRLHIDDALMLELREIRAAVEPDEILLVVDAMTGQDAVTVAESFHRDLELTGVLLTKLDGDARGGAALSVKAVIGKPIKFVGVGEKLDELEAFHPDRMADRILGMGDMLSLIEKVEANVDQEQTKKLGKKLLSGGFDFEDFLAQMKQMQKMGPLENILSMIPGLGQQFKNLEIDPKDLAHIEAMINSMTPHERRNPDVLKGSRSRRRRIANGSGMGEHEVNGLIRDFKRMNKMMKKMGKAGKGRRGGQGLDPSMFQMLQ